jgi:lipid A oxidase
MHHTGPIVTTIAAAFILAAPARAEVQLSLYSGVNLAQTADLGLTRPGGTDLVFTEVPWDTKPFTWPLYFGARGTAWLGRSAGWGFGIDYTHSKAYGRLTAVVPASGTLNGAAVNGTVSLNSVFSRLEFAPLSLLTAHVLYRRPIGRFTPYGGLGVGAAIPHVEVSQFGAPQTSQDQLAGFAVRGYAGLEYAIYGGFSLFGEYQVSYSKIDAGLTGGGTLRTELWNHHFNLGVAYKFDPF